MVNKKKMSRIFQMFTSPSKTVEDDGQEEVVTASTRPIRTTDAPKDETTKRPRRHSSNSAQDELRKKSRIESSGNIVEEEEEGDFSDEEVSLHVFANAPEWARAIMSYLRRSTQKLNASNSALNAKLTKLNEDFENFKKGKDQEIQHITTSLDFIHSKYDEMKIENEKLAAEVKRVESKFQDKVDELEQYSRRSCLVFTGIPEPPKAQREDTDKEILDLCRDKLGIDLQQRDLDRTHRLGVVKTNDRGEAINRAIIAKFSNYRIREEVFNSKKKLKDSGHAIYENLTKQRAELYKLARSIGGNRNVWTRDGTIFSVNHENKVFRVNTRADLENIKPKQQEAD